jgi:hypothetical protein
VANQKYSTYNTVSLHKYTATVQTLHKNLEFVGFGETKKAAKLDVCVRIWEGADGTMRYNCMFVETNSTGEEKKCSCTEYSNNGVNVPVPKAGINPESLPPKTGV